MSLLDFYGSMKNLQTMRFSYELPNGTIQMIRGGGYSGSLNLSSIDQRNTVYILKKDSFRINR